MAVESITGIRPACAKPMPASDGSAGTDGGARAVVMQQPVTDVSGAGHGGRTSGRALNGVHALRRAALGLDMRCPDQPEVCQCVPDSCQGRC